MKNILIAVTLSMLLAACGDSGVRVGDAGNTSGGNTGNTTVGDSNAGGNTGTTTGATTGNNGGNNGGNNDNNGGGDNPGNTTGNNTGGQTGDNTDTGTGDANTFNAAANLDPQDIDAARFLMQATFGPSQKSIDEFRAFASKSAWIDAQMNLPVSLTQPYTRANSNGSNRVPRHTPWWNNVTDEPDQLRQRVAFALSQIFVVSDLDYTLGNAQYGMSDYYDMLSRNAFGNYRNLLEDVTLHPVMGVYLSMVRNEKANAAEKIRPDENYAREVLQLFSIGLFNLNNRGEIINPGNPQPTYSQNTVEEFARVFTGWEFPVSRYWGDTALTDEAFVGRMVPDGNYHDYGAKTLLNGQVIPAGLSVQDDMKAALDNIFLHPNVGPFISKQLIQRLTTSNPSPEYVERVAQVFNNNGNGERGNLGAVVKAILLDVEAQQGINVNPNFGKIREPNIKLAHYWRALEAYTGPEANGVHNTADFTLDALDEMGGQAVMRSKSVFNFYLPDNPLAPGDSLISPEMQNMSEAYIAATHNNYHHLVYRFHNRADLTDDNPAVTITNLEPLADLSANPNDLLDWYNLMFFAGTMPDSMREQLRIHMLRLNNNDYGRFARAQDTLFMIMVSPAFNIQY
jgi:uncharacterized protein (DUF1800 family)